MTTLTALSKLATEIESMYCTPSEFFPCNEKTEIELKDNRHAVCLEYHDMGKGEISDLKMSHMTLVCGRWMPCGAMGVNETMLAEMFCSMLKEHYEAMAAQIGFEAAEDERLRELAALEKRHYEALVTFR